LVRRALLSANDQRFAALLPDRHDGRLSCSLIHVERHTVLPEEPQLTLSNRVGAEPFHVPRRGEWVLSQISLGLVKQASALFLAEPPHILDDRVLERDGPARLLPPHPMTSSPPGEARRPRPRTLAMPSARPRGAP